MGLFLLKTRQPDSPLGLKLSGYDARAFAAASPLIETPHVVSLKASTGKASGSSKKAAITSIQPEAMGSVRFTCAELSLVRTSRLLLLIGAGLCCVYPNWG